MMYGLDQILEHIVLFETVVLSLPRLHVDVLAVCSSNKKPLIEEEEEEEEEVIVWNITCNIYVILYPFSSHFSLSSVQIKCMQSLRDNFI